ncbi:regulator of microtubule dynamics protein 1 isoform 4-T6 [Porphyrio hochstetteri]
MAALALARSFRCGSTCLRRPLRREAAGSTRGLWGRGGPGARRGAGGSEVLRKSLQRGLALSTASFLAYEAHKLISGFAEVHASFKVEEVIEQADYLYGSGETEKLYQLLVQHKNSDDADLLWRLARASRDVAQLSTTSAEKKRKLTYESLEYAKKALEKNESNFAAHKWYGICLSDVGDFEGIKTKIGNAFIIKEHFKRAIELNPKDATTIHLIGIWCYSFAEMPWYQRKIAATLFATPPTSTFQERESIAPCAITTLLGELVHKAFV